MFRLALLQSRYFLIQGELFITGFLTRATLIFFSSGYLFGPLHYYILNSHLIHFIDVAHGILDMTYGAVST